MSTRAKTDASVIATQTGPGQSRNRRVARAVKCRALRFMCDSLVREACIQFLITRWTGRHRRHYASVASSARRHCSLVRVRWPLRAVCCCALAVTVTSLPLHATGAGGGEAPLVVHGDVERVGPPTRPSLQPALFGARNEEGTALPRTRGSLGAKVARVLAAVRAVWPEMARIEARSAFKPRTLIVALDPALFAAVSDALPAPGERAALCTGYAGFDRLNAALDLCAVQPFDFMSAILVHFDPFHPSAPRGSSSRLFVPSFARPTTPTRPCDTPWLGRRLRYSSIAPCGSRPHSLQRRLNQVGAPATSSVSCTTSSLRANPAPVRFALPIHARDSSEPWKM